MKQLNLPIGIICERIQTYTIDEVNEKAALIKETVYGLIKEHYH